MVWVLDDFTLGQGSDGYQQKDQTNGGIDQCWCAHEHQEDGNTDSSTF